MYKTDPIERYSMNMADIIVTHKCNRHCKFCCDKYVNCSDDVVTMGMIKEYLKILREVNKLDAIHNVMFLGGEPTIIGLDNLIPMMELVKKEGYKVSLTTNGYQKEKILQVDGLVDYLNISYYGKPNNYMHKFKNTLAQYNILVCKEYMPKREDLDRYIDELECVRFSTPNYNTLDRISLPDWFNEKEFPIVKLFRTMRGGIYREKMIKLFHENNPEYPFMKLWPEGNISFSWSKDEIMAL